MMNPEPFSDEARELYDDVSDIALDTLEQAFADARAPYGDEGKGYDLILMAALLQSEGWTPPQ
jgi:hypothetical protein